MSTDQWWTNETQTTDDDGNTYLHRSRTTGTVWDDRVTHDNNGKRRYRAQVWVMQHTDDGNYPDISLWTHNGATPPPVLTVEEARTLGYALLQAAELVDRERDATIRRFLDNTP